MKLPVILCYSDYGRRIRKIWKTVCTSILKKNSLIHPCCYRFAKCKIHVSTNHDWSLCKWKGVSYSKSWFLSPGIHYIQIMKHLKMQNCTSDCVKTEVPNVSYALLTHQKPWLWVLQIPLWKLSLVAFYIWLKFFIHLKFCAKRYYTYTKENAAGVKCAHHYNLVCKEGERLSYKSIQVTEAKDATTTLEH